MNLIKDHWSKKDIKEFNDYLLSIKKPDKIDFTRRVVNTNMEVLGISCPTCKDIAKQIHGGNYYEFLEMND